MHKCTFHIAFKNHQFLLKTSLTLQCIQLVVHPHLYMPFSLSSPAFFFVLFWYISVFTPSDFPTQRQLLPSFPSSALASTSQKLHTLQGQCPLVSTEIWTHRHSKWPLYSLVKLSLHLLDKPQSILRNTVLSAYPWDHPALASKPIEI